MARILQPAQDPARKPASNATNIEQPPTQTRAAQQSSTDVPSDERVMAEARAIYPDTSPGAPSEQEIAAEAYSIYLGRGGEHGQDIDDWLNAERRLRELRR